MIDKLRIAVVVKAGKHQTSKGTILFGRSMPHLYDDIELTKYTGALSENRLISTVIDTTTAKGDATLGAFLLMAYRYRSIEYDEGLDWSLCKINTDPAYRALTHLYEHGTLDDEVDVTCDGQTKRISRKSAIALGLLKGE